MGLFTKFLEATSKKILIADSATGDPYMMRYIFFKSKYGSIYFHRFLQGDQGNPHDHPWNFFTFVISKGYKERLFTQDMDKGLYTETIVHRKPLSLAFRRAEAVHLVEVDKKRSLAEIEDAPLTMCIMLRRRRVWGFLEMLPDGYRWVNWLDYLGIDKTDPRYHGSE